MLSEKADILCLRSREVEMVLARTESGIGTLWPRYHHEALREPQVEPGRPEER